MKGREDEEEEAPAREAPRPSRRRARSRRQPVVREDAVHEADDEPEEGMPQPPAAPQTEDGEPEEGTPEPPAAAPDGGSPGAQREPATERHQRKSKFRHVSWETKTQPGKRGWFGMLAANSKHPRCRTAYFHTEEEAARAVDR